MRESRIGQIQSFSWEQYYRVPLAGKSEGSYRTRWLAGGYGAKALDYCPPILASKYRIREGIPNPRGAHWDGRGVNFSLFSAHATAVELCCSTSKARAKSNASSCRNTPTRSGTDISKGLARAMSTATASTGRTRPRKGTASIPTSCCSIRTRAEFVGALEWNHACFGYTIGADDDDLSFNELDSAPVRAQVRGGRCGVRLEAERASARRLGPDDHLRDARARLHAAAPGGRGDAARHVRGPGDAGSHRLHHGRSASRRSS